MIDKHFFIKHQRKLVWFANTRFGKRIFRISGDIPKGKRIVKILPNCVTWLEKIEGKKVYLTTDFRSHDKFAKRLLYAFYPIWYLCHLWDILIANKLNPAWNLGFDTLTAYPQPGTGTAPVDGGVGEMYSLGTNNYTFSDLVNGSGNVEPRESEAHLCVTWNNAARSESVGWRSDLTSPYYHYMWRAIVGFDTSSLGSSATISSATLSLYRVGSDDSYGYDPNINVYSASPSDESDLAPGDYANVGSTAFSTGKSLASDWTTNGYKDYSLNSSGISHINKTGNTFFSVRTENDATNTAPSPWDAEERAMVTISSADETGTTQDPKLVVTYTAPAAEDALFFGVNF